MNRQQIIDLIKNPHHLNENSLDEIREILDSYPFFQAGRMLWIKNLYMLGHIRYNNELKLAAAHVPDRARLFDLIHASVVPDEAETRHMAQEEAVDAKESETSVSDAEISDQPVGMVGSDYFDVNDVFTTPSGTTFNYSSERYNTDDEQRHIIESSLPEDEENIVLPSGDLLGYELDMPSLYHLPASKASFTTNDAHSFSEWLSVLRYQPAPEAAKSEAKQKPAPEGKRKDLIDSFLKNNTSHRFRVVAGDKEPTGNVDISVSSVQEHDDLLTETLANIYIRQKHFLKAIDIFNRLRLKYPEKNIYFARRIKELEELINNQ
jgi:hypothetical protein